MIKSSDLCDFLVFTIHGSTQVNGLFQGHWDPRQGMLGCEEAARTTEINCRYKELEKAIRGSVDIFNNLPFY